MQWTIRTDLIGGVAVGVAVAEVVDPTMHVASPKSVDVASVRGIWFEIAQNVIVRLAVVGATTNTAQSVLITSLD